MHMPTVTVLHRSTSNPAPLAQHHRLALLRQTIDREDVPLQDRVAAALVLLYAQPLTPDHTAHHRRCPPRRR
ncbi:hypothetical protein ACH4SK_38980 [Streptomyces inhibens]|uniref:hypothetical protein n=1 Tax=Streptomyces inhibens TaxID=2293571 RepID=UPI0037A9A7CC